MADNIWDFVGVINVRDETERYARFQKNLKRSKLLSGHDVAHCMALTPETTHLPEWWRPKWAEDSKKAAGHWACRRSYMSILEKLIIQKIDHALIMEDDAYPRQFFDEDFIKFNAELPSGWLGYKLVTHAPAEKPQGRREQVSQNVWKMGGGGGSAAIGYSLEGMKRAMDHLWQDIPELVDVSLVKLMSKSEGWYRPDRWPIGIVSGVSSITGEVCWHDTATPEEGIL